MLSTSGWTNGELSYELSSNLQWYLLLVLVVDALPACL